MKRSRLTKRGPAKRRGPVKLRGWLALLLAIGFLLFGLAFGLAEYFIAAAIIALLLLIAAVQAVGQKPRFMLDVGAGRAVRGELSKVLLKVNNPRLWPFFPLRLSLNLQKHGQDPTELAYYEIGIKPRGEKTLEVAVICPHRGEYAVFLQPYYAEDVFGLFALPSLALPPQTLLSLPLTDMTPPEERDSALYENEETIQRRQWHQGQITAEARAYQQGDALRAIHWKKSASRRELFTRLREQESDYSCYLLLDNRPRGEGEEALDYEDRLCEAALSFLFSQLAANQPVTLLPGSMILQSPQSIDKAAELLATLPFSAEAVFDELKTLLESPGLPTELYIVLAQTPTPLLPFLELIINRGCPVILLAPTTDIELVKGGLELAIPLITINNHCSLLTVNC